MSERERWVIYPLLFLALGAALRDKLSNSTTAKSIKCQELYVVDEKPLGNEVVIARIGRNESVEDATSSEGEFKLNGQLQIVDRDTSGKQLTAALVTMGRSRVGNGGAQVGFVQINGQLNVNGVINSRDYAYRGVIPAIRGVLPGASLGPEMLRTIPDALAPKQPAEPDNSAPPSNPPAEPAAPAPEAKPDDAKGSPQASISIRPLASNKRSAG
jgi:hypothetical protein